MAWPAVLVSAAIGGMNYLSNKKNAQNQNKATDAAHGLAINKWEYDWQVASDDWAFAEEKFVIETLNAELQRNYENESRDQVWIDKMKIREFDWNNQVAAYNASVESYEDQLDYNALAADISLNDSTRKYNENLTKIGFQNEELVRNFSFNTRGLSLAQRKKATETAAKGQQLQTQQMAAFGSVANTGQAGRSARKNIQSVLAAHGVAQQGLLDMVLHDASQYALNTEKEMWGLEFGQRQLKESMSSATTEYGSQMQHIELKKWEADMAAESRIAPEPLLPPAPSKPLTLPKPHLQGPKKPRILDEKAHDSLRPVKGASVDTTWGPIASGISSDMNMYSSIPGGVLGKK